MGFYPQQQASARILMDHTESPHRQRRDLREQASRDNAARHDRNSPWLLLLPTIFFNTALERTKKLQLGCDSKKHASLEINWMLNQTC
ncbi:hypothetical protein MUK42_07085 [Musa troglodytarum]|uniref:Uncharacterized protein n=1 Tax=Musa troglodytarum TaxID=320322 RepID=A0A9E7L7N4_9LILI|nr:hypothetical protein MUK42_07085 [Musa troglodytarum]